MINEDYKNAIEYEMKMIWNENEPRDRIYIKGYGFLPFAKNKKFKQSIWPKISW